MRGFVCSVGVGLVAFAAAKVLSLAGVPAEAQSYVLVGAIGLGLITAALTSARADR